MYCLVDAALTVSSILKALLNELQMMQPDRTCSSLPAVIDGQSSTERNPSFGDV